MPPPTYAETTLTVVCFVVTIWMLYPAAASCQTPATGSMLQRGDRVRISIANLENTQQWHVGKLSRLKSGSITIVTNKKNRELTVLSSDIDGFQRSLGRDTKRGVQWMGGGAAFGFVMGAGLTLLSNDELADGSRGNWVTAGFGFAAIGAVVAGIIGFEEQWGDVDLSIDASLSGVARPSVTAGVRF